MTCPPTKPQHLALRRFQQERDWAEAAAGSAPKAPEPTPSPGTGDDGKEPGEARRRLVCGKVRHIGSPTRAAMGARTRVCIKQSADVQQRVFTKGSHSLTGGQLKVLERELKTVKLAAIDAAIRAQVSWPNPTFARTMRWTDGAPQSAPKNPGRKQKCGQSKRRRWRPALPTRWKPPPRVCRFCVRVFTNFQSILPPPSSLRVHARAGVSNCVRVCVHARAQSLAPVSGSRAFGPSFARVLPLSLHLFLTHCLEHLPP